MPRQAALGWAAEMRALIGRHRLALFGLIVGLQVTLLLGVIFVEERRQTGVEIVLESLPVDPRDPLRGDYVILRYQAEDVDGLPGARAAAEGDQLYVTFEDRGRYWEPTALGTRNLSRDEWEHGRVAVRARVVLESPLRVEYPDLGEYFVPRGTGVLPLPPDVHIAVSRDGVARITYLEVDGERWPRD